MRPRKAEIQRLEAARLAALELRIEADLALGRHSQLVPELEALVREHPLHERLAGALMQALYGAGRQAEALEVYRKTRQTFVAELGIEPSPALRELEQAILRQDPELAPESSQAVRCARSSYSPETSTASATCSRSRSPSRTDPGES